MGNKNETKKVNKFKAIFDPRWFLNDFAKFTGIIPSLIYYRMKNIYLDKASKKSFRKEACVISCNHHSFGDPFVCLSHFWFKRTTFLTLEKLFQGKFNHFMFTYIFNCIPVNKEKVSINVFKKAKEYISKGHSLVIYPEGTVAHESDAVDPFKAGSIMIASMNDVPIYPAYIVKRKHWYLRSKVIIGARFDIKDFIKGNKPTKEEMNYCSELLYKKTKELEQYAKDNNLL